MEGRSVLLVSAWSSFKKEDRCVPQSNAAELRKGECFWCLQPWRGVAGREITRRLLVVSIGGWRVWRRKSDFFKEILVQDHFYRKYWLNHKFFELDLFLCLPLLMMNNGAIALWIADSEQRLSVRLCAGWFVAPNTPFIECHWFISFLWNGMIRCISMIASSMQYSSGLCPS